MFQHCRDRRERSTLVLVYYTAANKSEQLKLQTNKFYNWTKIKKEAKSSDLASVSLLSAVAMQILKYTQKVTFLPKFAGR